MTPLQKFQQRIWRALYPVFPWMEHHMLFFHAKERQRFHVGWLRSDKSLADLKRHLAQKWGFGNHFVAWEDTDQVLSWRKLISFSEQYHLRVYSDGEIRGHYELTPEGAPIRHFVESGEQPKLDDFKKFLDGFMTDQKSVRHLEPDTTVPTPDSEITFQDSNQGK